jgi:hypothetical protein
MANLSMKSMLVASAAAIGLTGLAAPASAQDVNTQIQNLNDRLTRMEAAVKQGGADQAVTRGNRPVRLELSGHVNKAFMWANDGRDKDVWTVDNNYSNSRIRFVGRGDINEDVSVGTLIEYGFGNNESSSAVNATTNRQGRTGLAAPVERHADLFFSSKTFGTLRLGQGSTASEDSTWADLSGTGVVTLNAQTGLMGGAIPFTTSTPAGTVNAGINGNQAFATFNGLGRDKRVRYDTPTFFGFSAKTSYINGGAADVAAQWGGEIAGTRMVARGAYTNANSGLAANNAPGAPVGAPGFELFSASASVLFPFGLNLTGAYGHRNYNASGVDSARMYYGKVGYSFSALEMGSTNLAVEYTRTRNNSNTQVAGPGGTLTGSRNGTKARAYGVAAVQNIDVAATELYAKYERSTVSVPAVSTNAIHMAVVGSRIRF